MMMPLVTTYIYGSVAKEKDILCTTFLVWIS